MNNFRKFEKSLSGGSLLITEEVIEITSRLVSAHDFYFRVVMDR